ncbi:hypothetical protein L226DRAFT_275362 [Lentinus tigrinus ALCF2SS1-7]|uniref:uncharacterized protein n=1 Tax=Lentinus tigrinus ALCF2SS1-7 TaxID=1328758 RepID=UPI001165DC08|nr:hypothetical protein L226DRAFT_275362 [Lentinus tigrinus ALCF2SS1-7]
MTRPNTKTRRFSFQDHLFLDLGFRAASLVAGLANSYGSHRAEVILARLLKTFSFAPSEKRIVWNMHTISFSTVANESNPSLSARSRLYDSGSQD